MMTDQLSNGQLIATRQSLSGVIKVFENSLFRWICLEDEQAIQSCMLKDQPTSLILPYQQFMMMWQLLLREKTPASVCLMGVGGGDIVRYLSHTFPALDLLAVDHDPEIARVACEFFLLQPDQQHFTIEIAAAERFIKKPAQFDLLLIDIVADNAMPGFIFDVDFWRDCHSNLKTGGVLVANIIPQSEGSFVKLLEIIQAVFGHLPLCMDVPEHKNVVLLLALTQDSVPSINELQQRSVELKNNSDLPFDECMTILRKDNAMLMHK